MPLDAPTDGYPTVDAVGRDDELASLRALLEDDGPRVVHVHGIAGIGKSTLLRVFLAEAEARGALTLPLDCREVEPTPAGLLAALAEAAGGEADTHESLLRRLAAVPTPVLLALDTFEVFRLMDTWLRTVLIPAISDNVRIILAGRHQPAAAWFAGGLEGRTRMLRLSALDNETATALLRRAGLATAQCPDLIPALHGHPLALRLAASALAARPGLDFADTSLQRVMATLTGIHLADVDDPALRRVIEATAVIRRVSVPLLASMFPEEDAESAYVRLGELPFIEFASDGLRLHEAVREAVAQTFRARDPGRHLDYRRRAWRALARQATDAARPDLWRYTADMLYLVENPVCREAFFPSGASELHVENARPGDAAAIAAICQRHEGVTGAERLAAWRARQPDAFMVVRDGLRACVGLCCRFDPSTVAPELLDADPMTAAWQADLRDNPLAAGERALFIRRWLSRDAGEQPGPAQAAAWLDLKRTYMEMRPALRRVYLTVNDLTPYAAVATELGFRILPERCVEMDGRTCHSAVLDFGPDSVDGWLAHLAATELGLTHAADLLDRDARELQVDGRRVPLTPLEFALLEYLRANTGRALSRAELLREVWGSDYTGWSNKVDAVVAGVRRKLGRHAECIQTVTGLGYRYRDPWCREPDRARRQ